MPHLVKMQDELRDSGFIIIGNHVQNVEKKKVVGLARSLKVNFTITSHARVRVPNKGSGIPRAFLFDSKGQLVEKGHPMQMLKAIHDLVEKSPHFLAAGREYERLGRYAAALKGARSYGSIIKKLARYEDEEGAAGEEAAYLLGRIRGYGNRLLKKARAEEEVDPYAAYQLYTEVAAKWRSDEVGDRASDRLKEIKKDKDYQDELKAGKIAEAVRKELDQMVADKDGNLSFDYAPNKKVAGRVVGIFRLLKKKYPETKATRLLAEELEGYGLSG